MNVGYHAAVRRGRIARRTYELLLARAARPLSTTAPAIDADVVAFSGRAVLPEQVASIRSFLRHVGVPSKLTVFSDGTYDARSEQLLTRIDPCVEVRALDTSWTAEASAPLRAYAAGHPLGKKLVALSNMPTDKTLVYVDSDVLFFPAATGLREGLGSEHRYLVDCHSALDERLLRNGEAALEPVNSGLCVFAAGFDWSSGLARLAQLDGDASFYTEQTVVHLAMHENGAERLDPNDYVVSRADDFRFSDGFPPDRIAMRHYVAPIRYRFWASHGLWLDAVGG